MSFSPRLRWKLDQIRKKTSSAFAGQKEPARPKLCPACGTLVGASATRCHQCGANLNFSLAAASKSLGRLMPATSPVTYTILAFSCVLYVVCFLLTIRETGLNAPGGGISGIFGLGGIAGNILVGFGESVPFPLIIAYHQPWRYVTAIFLHASLLHIIFNMWVLMDVGPSIEELYGSARYFFIYIAAGVGGFILSSTVGGNPSVGGSGALLGLIGVMLANTFGRRSAGAQMLRSQIYIWLVLLVIWGFMPGMNVDNYAHAGGFATGFVLGRLMADRPPVTPEARKLAYILGWATALVVLGSFVMMVFWLHQVNLAS